MVITPGCAVNQHNSDPELAELIAEASEAFAPSQAELAAEIGVRPLALTTWRNGRSRPTAEHLLGMAKALEEQSERLRNLAVRLSARAAAQGPLTRRPRRAATPDLRTSRLLALRMVAAGRGNVERIVFHGSRARGTGSPASDWDFVIVLRDGTGDIEAQEALLRSAASAIEGSDESMPAGEAFRLDVWALERAEWESARKLHGHPVRTAEQEGVVLYGA
jgi:predicted nucleotidyltransferase/DNA-binding XRE family transcriptional regulator